ncbi:arginine decarboxylase [Vitreoscilla sp. C1]|uniref:arginine decarboxylase n=1 Tax=Vitreoscilla sp. (strain C1) TaxID=96942 RepID=UPI00148ECAEF|nr:arginine decarboxylase [Vitreoscilla sp. C1]AUZ06224.2 arginine decarboxylase [Vitreoscilla sp. C1]
MSWSWEIEDAASVYGINHWGDGYFGINAKGHVSVTPRGDSEHSVDVYELVERVNQRGQDLPMLFRFPDILQDRVKRLCAAFDKAIDKYEYQGQYTAIYPIKVNQQESVVKNIIATHEQGASIGLEAGSKPELMIVLAFAPKGGTIVCNGYKDRDFIRMALIGQKLGHNVYIVIEKESEVDLIIEESKHLGVCANLGLRVRLSSLASSKWADTGGDKGKFGLSAAQLMSAQKKLQAAGLAEYVRLMHFHMGSQIANIADYRLGFREALRYFAELRALGLPIDTIDVGGGLGVDYDGTRSRNDSSINYSMSEYAHVIVNNLQEFCQENGLQEPNIFSESGRAMTAHHAVLVMNVTDVERLPSKWDHIEDMDSLSFPVRKLLDYTKVNDADMVTETYHRITVYFNELTTLYAEGKIGLAEKALGEQLYSVLCQRLHKQLLLLANQRSQRQVFDLLNDKLADKYFCNFSVFQSLPDTWAINQVLPIMPLHRLDEQPTRRAVLQDLTCDSDGKVSQYIDQQSIESNMPVHDLNDQPYLLGVFLVGAYQEILGDMHNLFGDTDSINVYVNDDGSVRLDGIEEHDTIEDMLAYVHLSSKEILNRYEEKIRVADLSANDKKAYFAVFCHGLKQSSYLSV